MASSMAGAGAETQDAAFKWRRMNGQPGACEIFFVFVMLFLAPLHVYFTTRFTYFNPAHIIAYYE